ncbi:MAG: hypothetical protein VX835_03445 [Pseudomonadota bacterium]|nr:hypothetical protein [Pseudomonadota bacterium]
MIIKEIVVIFYLLTMQVVIHADGQMKQVRSHLTQANDAFCETSQYEIEQWGRWFRFLIRKDKQRVKHWLKEKIDHC